MAPSAVVTPPATTTANLKIEGKIGGAPNGFTSHNLEPLCQIVTPLGMLGYGFDENLVNSALKNLASVPTPTALVADSGSTDSGPSKLALGSMTCPRSSYKRDLRKLILSVLEFRVPLLLSSAGGDGSNAHVDEFLTIIQEILDSLETPRKLKVLAIYSQISKALILEKLKAGDITGCGPAVPPLTVEDIEDSPTIVAQMGPEPFMQAMTEHPDFDIIIGGRAYDPVPHVAFCAYTALNGSYEGFQNLNKSVLGGFMHMGKIMECGASCARPKTKSTLAKIYTDGTFDVRPLDPTSKCLPLSVAAHTLYEKPRPDRLYGPGGYLDLSATTYHQLKDGVSVRAQGGTFVFSTHEGQDYTVKLEAAKVAGYRSIFIGNFHDQILVAQIRSMLDRIKDVLLKQNGGVPGLKVDFHVYGLDKKAVSLESLEAGKPELIPMEVFVVGEVLADSQEAATTIASAARVACLHGSYPGQKATAGNLGMGIGGPLELECGPSAEFSIYHLMPISKGQEGAREISSEENKICNDLWGNTKLFTYEAVELGSGDYQPRTSNGHIQSNTKALEILSVIPSEEQQKLQFTKPPRTLGGVASVLRSKNSGPFELTLDVIFEDADLYYTIKKAGILTPSVIAKLYNLQVDDIIWCGFFDQALGFKATIPRTRNGMPMASGGFMEDDVHGSQKHLPLMELPLDASLTERLAGYGKS